MLLLYEETKRKPEVGIMESAFLGHLMSSSKHRTNVERLKTKARTGVWDENHFFDWLKEATVEDWTEVEELWQRAHCSELLNWPALRQSLECTARKDIGLIGKSRKFAKRCTVRHKHGWSAFRSQLRSRR